MSAAVEDAAPPSADQRAQLASSLLLQTPPGQIANVYADLSSILLSTLPEGATQASATEEATLFQQHATRALESYNTEQLVPFRLPGSDRTTLICRAAQLPGSDTAPALPRYLDPSTAQSFAFDHFKLTASDIQSHPPDPTTEPLRLALQASVDSYLANHFPDGVGAVFVVYAPSTTAPPPPPPPPPPPQEEEQQSPQHSTSDAQVKEAKEADDAVAAVEASEAVEAEKSESDAAAPPEAEAAQVAAEEEAKEQEQESQKEAAPASRPEWAGEPSYVIHVTGNRFNPQNFWAGRWRSSYTYTPGASTSAPADIDASPLGTLRAHIALHVHYYEEGNVQLHLQSPPDSAFLPLPAALPSAGAAAPGSTTEKALAKLLFSLIGKHEDVFQRELGDVLSEQFAEKAMRGLRRALPITRQRVDWDKLVNYQLGSELGRSA
ncbi:F-actin-capping protein subunit alpha [Tilletia horrida]|uniref:F-actin-capping protein subunit alpha n=1 Tax=Tilletia horrida TaxID=155126 RepID=A0AAN6GB16_9BASI|nr:F-actin-capping protein subunit alpha [Tilletia horrida]